MTPRQIIALLVLSAFWGGSFIFMRVAAPELGPILLIELRVLIAGLALLAYGAVSRSLQPLGAAWKQYLVVAAINSAVPFLLIATASLYLPASVTATLNATTPLFGAAAAAVLLGERLTVRKGTGILLGIVGVASLVGLGPLPWVPATFLAIGASLLAALSYGIAAVYTKAKVKGSNPLALSTWSQLFAALVIMPLVPFSLPAGAPSGIAVGSTVALAILCTAVGYLLYFYLIVNAGPTKATLVTFLSPAFGMLWAAVLLQEPLGVGHFLGFGLILGSVALVSGKS